MNHSARRINHILEALNGDHYLEVGVSTGETFRDVSASHKMAVDPQFRFDYRSLQTPRCQFFEMTSDVFFTESIQAETFDVIFLDGLHTFEQTFRDFCCSLKHSHARTVWLIDDVVPCDIYSSWPNLEEAIAFRKLSGTTQYPFDWHGDVFKVVFAIHDFFPNLSYVTTRNQGNPQAMVWSQPRQNFQPRFNSLEKISRLTWFDLQLHQPILNLDTEENCLTTVVGAIA